MNKKRDYKNPEIKDTDREAENKHRYAADRPKDCRYCYYWSARGMGCRLGKERCYYRLPDRPAPHDEGKCKGCPYGRVNPCIGYCLRDIMSRTKNRENSL